MKTRELKFRVWDEKYRCWDWHMFVGYPDQPLISQGRIFQQFTGYKDVNNRDIYEGDIVKIKTWGREYTIEVCWNDLRLSVDGQLEIIGNIFENPDLLK